MSDTSAKAPDRPTTEPDTVLVTDRDDKAGGRSAGRIARLDPRRAAVVAGWFLLFVPPFYLSAFWLQTGLFAMAAVIAAIGLNLLAGVAGQLSLGHAFFLAVGAYGYTWLADSPDDTGPHPLSGLALPPLVAFVAAVLLTGAVGALFSPISGRLRGMYLGVATLALVFLGQHVMLNATSLTGGFNGRGVPPMEIFGLSLDDRSPLNVLGIPFGGLERLWYFGVLLVLVAALAARNLVRGRPGRALGALRDSEVAAGAMGVAPGRLRAAAFTVSAMYAGAGGALLALAFQRIVPDHFGLVLSMDFLAMIVIGGLGSVGGAAAGAVFVTLLPQVLGQYADRLPLVVGPGSTEPGLGAPEAARYLYGAVLVLILLFAPSGLAGLRFRRPTLPRRPGPRSAAAPSPLPAGPDTADGNLTKEHTP